VSATLLIGLGLYADSRPPVVLVEGASSCSGPSNASQQFGQLQEKLSSQGVETYFFGLCSVLPPGAHRAPTLDELGQGLRVLIQGIAASQVDLVAYSFGNIAARSYLSGKQAEPGVFKPPANHKVRKAVLIAGPQFGDGEIASVGRQIWDLATWNLGADDLRQIDAVAIVGSTDGFETLSDASISFAYPPERTRVIAACHNRTECLPGIAYIDSDSHPTWRIIDSFLAGTDEWKKIGIPADQDPVGSRQGGVIVGVKDGFDSLIPASEVSLSGTGLSKARDTGLFFETALPKGNYTLRATAAVAVPDVSFSSATGTFSVITMKPGPVISAVLPAGSTVRPVAFPAGSAIEIYGVRLSAGGVKTADPPFPTSLGGTEVTVGGQPIPLKSVGDSQISAQLPAGVTGFVGLKVTTSAGAHSVNMFLEASAASKPQIAKAGVVNAASFVSGAVAPGEFVSIVGTNLGPVTAVTAIGSQKGLGGTTVTFDGIEAFLTYSSATQVNGLVPYGVKGKADAQVQFHGAASDVFPLGVEDSAPGIFTQNYGPGQAWALNDDSTFNSSTNRVARDGWIVFWATGQGLVSPAGEDGETLATPKNVNLPVSVSIGGVEAPLLYALVVYTGEIQVAARVPGGVQAGDVPLVLTIGNANSRGDVTIAVK
jgi:uncharacterized protein (TIGR03437 family)